MSSHVPERARIRDDSRVGTTEADGNNGAFTVPSPEAGWILFLICSDGLAWEHVSVHAASGKRERTPTWKEMAFIKALCWDDDDVAIQFHPRRREYVNQHPHTLHLWRPIGIDIPTPPPALVGTLNPEATA